jgi:hypothetical protein
LQKVKLGKTSMNLNAPIALLPPTTTITTTTTTT